MTCGFVGLQERGQWEVLAPSQGVSGVGDAKNGVLIWPFLRRDLSESLLASPPPFLPVSELSSLAIDSVTHVIAEVLFCLKKNFF